MLKKIKKNLLLSLAFASLVYLGLTIYADYESVLESFKTFAWMWFPVVLILSFLNYSTRFLKWHYYLNILKCKVPWKDSFAVFMSGLIMSVTPGKMGELLKSYLVKQITGDPISKTAPIVFVERITDFLSLIIIALIGAYVFDYGKIIVLGTGIVFITLVIVLSQKNLSLKLLDIFCKIKFVNKHKDSLLNAYQSSYEMLKPVPLLSMIPLSLLAWFFECLGFYLIIVGFGADVSLFWASFVYAFATIAGSITMLPGGLGVTDGSLTFLMISNGIGKDTSVSATFLIRVATLWFAILVGIITVLLYNKRFENINNFNLDDPSNEE